MFSFFKKKPPAPAEVAVPAATLPAPPAVELAVQIDSLALASAREPAPAPAPEPTRRNWFAKLRLGLAKTGSSIAQVFTGTQIDDALYEELETALLMADAGVKATEFLLEIGRASCRERV